MVNKVDHFFERQLAPGAIAPLLPCCSKSAMPPRVQHGFIVSALNDDHKLCYSEEKRWLRSSVQVDQDLSRNSNISGCENYFDEVSDPYWKNWTQSIANGPAPANRDYPEVGRQRADSCALSVADIRFTLGAPTHYNNSDPAVFFISIEYNCV